MGAQKGEKVNPEGPSASPKGPEKQKRTSKEPERPTWDPRNVQKGPQLSRPITSGHYILESGRPGKHTFLIVVE